MIQSSSPKRRHGTIAVLTVFLLVIVIGMAAFAVDIGTLAVARSEAQTAADAAAMAGMTKLAEQLKRAPIAQGTAVQTSADLALAREEAKTFGQKNRIASDIAELKDSDIEIGYMANPYDHSNNSLDTSGWPARPYNAVRVHVRRDQNHTNGQLKLFFAQFLGSKQTNAGATATAAFTSGSIRPRGNQAGYRGGLLPFAYQVDQWNAIMTASAAGTVTAANGASVALTDNYATDTQSTGAGAVSNGSDKRWEFNAYPSSTTSGNFGTINFSKSKTGNSTNVLRDLIENGPEEADWPDLPEIVAATAANPVEVNGDPGISAGMESAVEAIIGEPHIILLYSTASGNGNNTYYKIVGFAPVTVVDVNLHGGSKYIKMQPSVLSIKSEVSDAEKLYFDVTPGASSNSLFIGARALVR
jgi:hypothetical protein